jgi:hypothetical protein
MRSGCEAPPRWTDGGLLALGGRSRALIERDEKDRGTQTNARALCLAVQGMRPALAAVPRSRSAGCVIRSRPLNGAACGRRCRRKRAARCPRAAAPTYRRSSRGRAVGRAAARFRGSRNTRGVPRGDSRPARRDQGAQTRRGLPRAILLARDEGPRGARAASTIESPSQNREPNIFDEDGAANLERNVDRLLRRAKDA